MDDLFRLRQDLLTPDEGVAGPRRIGRYDIVREISRGGMGVVYEAFDPPLRRRVALKVVAGGPGREALARRLQQEAAAVARLRHPNIVSIFEVGSFEESPGLQSQFIAMDYIEGGTLAEQMPFLSRRERLAVLQTVALAADFAHEQGIIHRDLKPQNVLMERLTGSGTAAVSQRVFLSDFGLAKVEGEDLTRTGSVLGTASYMAPEQVRGEGKAIGPRTDVWALGVILYQMLTDRKPFEGPTPLEIYERIIGVDPVPPRRVSASIAADLETVCLKALEKDPERRYASAAAFADELRRYFDGEPIQARPASALSRLWRRSVKNRRVIAAGVAAAIALGAAGGWMIVRERRAKARDEVREQARRLLEDARPPLDRAWGMMYRADTDMESIRETAAKCAAPLDRALALSPDLAPARALRGWAWELQGREDRAEADYREAIRTDPGYAPARYRLGRLLLGRIQFLVIESQSPTGSAITSRDFEPLAAEAAREFSAAIAAGGGLVDPTHARVAERVQEILRGGARPPLEDDVEAFAGKEGVEELWLLLAITAPTFEGRVKAATRALEIRPKFAMAHAIRGVLHQSAYQSPEAERDFEAAIAIHPRFGKAYLFRGELRQQRGDAEGAMKDYDRALEIDPADWQALDFRCNHRRIRGDLKGALADLAEASRINPGHAFSYLNRGRLEMQRGDFGKALESLGQGIVACPQLLPLYIDRALVLAALQRYDEAHADLDRAIAARQGAYPEALLAKTQVFCAQKQYENAYRVADAIRTQVPAYAGMACFVMGEAVVYLGRPLEAIPLFTAAIEGNFRSGEVYGWRAKARLQTGDYAGGEADIVEALKLMTPDRPDYKALEEALLNVRRKLAPQEH